MKTLTTPLLVLLLLYMVPQAAADDTARELKDKLFARYDQKNFSVMIANILVAQLAEGPGFNGRGKDRLEYSVNYDFFDPAFSKDQWPSKYKKRNLLDERTTEELESRATSTDTLGYGEMVQTRLFYVYTEKSGQLQVDLYLVPLSGKRTASSQHIDPNGNAGIKYKVDWGCHFRFWFPPKAPAASLEDYYGYLAERIGRYFIPTDDYLRIQRANATPRDPASIPGKYVDEKNLAQFVQLNVDKSCTFRLGGKDYAATYALSGYELTFVVQGQDPSRGWLAGQSIIWGDSSAWTKEGHEETRSEPDIGARMVNLDVLQLAGAKLSDSVIVAKIKASSCKFDTSPDTLVKLKGSGVSDAVIQAMIECPPPK